MPSPFPGMDPYLEARDLAPDLHHELASAIRRALVPRLTPRYAALVYHRETTETVEPDEVRIVLPDVAVVKTRRGMRRRRDDDEGRRGMAVTPAVEVAMPVAVPVPQFRIEVQDATTRELVTAIELVSHTNKAAGADGDAYLRKREAYLTSEAHFIEIDLLRGGARPSPPETPRSAYRVFLSRADRRIRASVWPIALRDPLPTVPVPLRAPDADVPLDLQAALASVYDACGYDALLDYAAAPPPPAFDAGDARWVRGRTRRARP